jgi:2-iminobutanoate/2-iminopropanoate deaminase
MQKLDMDPDMALRGAWRHARGSVGERLMIKRIAFAMTLVLLCAGPTFAADRRIVLPAGTKADGNYVPGILVDGTLYISGQAGEDASGKIPDEFDAEVKQSLDNIGGVLKEAGMSPANVVSVQVYLTDGALFPKMNAIYTKYFQPPRPTRTTVVVAKLVGPGRIEITATARK